MKLIALETTADYAIVLGAERTFDDLEAIPVEEFDASKYELVTYFLGEPIYREKA